MKNLKCIGFLLVACLLTLVGGCYDAPSGGGPDVLWDARNGDWASTDSTVAFNLQFGEDDTISGKDLMSGQQLSDGRSGNFVTWTLADGTRFAGTLTGPATILLDSGPVLEAVAPN